MIQGSVTALGNKFVGILVSFLSVPLTIGYLGPERYGIWLTIGSLLAWLALTDFGLGMGFNTAISTAVGQERQDIVRQHISTALALLAAIALAVGIVGAVAWPWIDWSSLFGARTPRAKSELEPALACAIVIWLVQFPLSIVGRIYNAYQEGRITNYWGVVGNLASLAALFAVTRSEGGLVWLVLSISGTTMVLNFANTLWLFLRHKPFLFPHYRDFSADSLKQLTRTGGVFFLIQIMSLLVFQSNTFVVGHFLGADQVPTYSITYNLFNYCLIVQTLAFTYLWTAYSEAIARGDIAWVRRTFHRTLAAGTLLTLVLALGVALVAKPFITWWAGPAVVPPTALVLWMAAWAVLNGFTSPVACLLASASHLRNQTIYSAIACAANIALAITLVQSWGLTGVIASAVLSYAVFICGPTIIDAEFLLKKLERKRSAGTVPSGGANAART